MGDTVVKAVKDVTIWFGEVTVLPSDEGSTKDRLKHGIYKATMGIVDPRSANSGDVEEGYQEMHPALTRVFRGRDGKKSKRQDRTTKDRLTANFERSEKPPRTLPAVMETDWQKVISLLNSVTCAHRNR